MQATTRRTVITAGGEIAVTIAPGVQALLLTDLGGHSLIGRPRQTTRLLRLQPNAVPKAAPLSRSGVTSRVFNAGTNELLGRRSSQLRCRLIFYRKSAPSPKLFSRSNKATLPIRYSVWPGCSWSAPSGIASAFVHWIITR